jgi:hypothetical protein
MTRLGLIRPNRNCETGVGFGCRLPYRSSEFDVGSSAPETRVAP